MARPNQAFERANFTANLRASLLRVLHGSQTGIFLPTGWLAYLTRVQVWLEHSKPPATQPLSFSELPLICILPV